MVTLNCEDGETHVEIRGDCVVFHGYDAYEFSTDLVFLTHEDMKKLVELYNQTTL